MQRIGIDTNVLLDYQLEREPGFTKAKLIIEMCLAGKIILFIPFPVWLELEWVLRSVYDQTKEQIIEYLEELLLVPNVVTDKKEEINTSLNIYNNSNRVSFTDCVIAQQTHSREFELLTFDKDLEKLFQSL